MTRGTLDDPASVEAVDRSGMLAVAAGLGNQLRTGFRLGKDVEGLTAGSAIKGIVVCGMGGSGIAADVARSLLGSSSRVPLTSCKGYALPGSCDSGTLVVAVSFSGNTEETVAAYEAAAERGCAAVSVSAGGAMAERAVADGRPHVAIPSEVEMPRAAVGYLAGAVLGIVEATAVAPPIAGDVDSAGALVDDLAERLGPGAPLPENEAKELALWLAGRTPVIWGSEGLAEAPALRWKNQLNENAKVPAFCSVLPELDHNEVEGWGTGLGIAFGLVVLRHRTEHARIGPRIEASLDAVRESGLSVRQVWAEGATPAENLFSLIAKADFTSVYLAVMRGVDPTPVPVLTGLKERLRP